MTARRYLVTGCAGFIGSHLAEALLARGDEVIGVDVFTDYYPRSAKESNIRGLVTAPGFSLVEADLATEPLPSQLEQVDGVFHLAAQPGVRGSWGETFGIYVRDNILVTQRLFEAAAPLDLRVVLASSSSVYGNAEAYPTAEDVRPRPVSPYGVTKLACESLAGAYAESLGLDFVALRYFTVYGPRQRPDMAFAKIARALAEGSSFTVHGSGDQTRDVTYVADAIRATCLAMDRGPSRAIYNVGGGSETSLRTALELCERSAARPLDVRYGEAVPGDVHRTAADTSLIRRELGWVPETSLEEGMRAHLEWAGVAATA
jgi:UDP-glucuronate 4-epimerase